MGICGQEIAKKKSKKETKGDIKTDTKIEAKTKSNIETKIETDYKTVKSELDNYNNKKNNLENSIKKESENIITMLEAEESDNSYPSLDQIVCHKLNKLIKEKKENKEKLKLLKKKEKNLEELLEEIKNKSSKENEKEKIERIESKYARIIKQKLDKKENEKEGNFESSLDEITRLFNTFIDQRNIIINEINGISNRKRNFYSAFAQKKYYNFKYPNYLQNDLDEIRKRVEDSFINFEKKIKEIRKKINDELKKLLNKQINLSNDINKENNNNVNFEKDIMNIIDEQKKIEDDSIKEKDIKIENAFVESKKGKLIPKFLI